MKKFFSIFLCAVVLVGSTSCNKEPKPEPVPQYTTLADIMKIAGTSSSNEFSKQVKDIVVTAVYNNYVQLEDATAGASYTKTGHGLKAGDVISGKLTGKARVVSGALTLSALDLSACEITTTDKIPCTELTLKEVQNDKEKYLNRRIKLVNVTFVNAMVVGENVGGSLSQQGVQLSVTCRHATETIEAGAQGDVICYPASSTCYIYSTDDFTPHEIESPITGKSVYGVYKVSGEAVTDYFVYRPFVDQWGACSLSGGKTFRLQNYAEKWVVAFCLNTGYTLRPGMVVPYSLDVLGKKDVSPLSGNASVEKIKDGNIWLMDYDGNFGFVIKGE